MVVAVQINRGNLVIHGLLWGLLHLRQVFPLAVTLWLPWAGCVGQSWPQRHLFFSPIPSVPLQQPQLSILVFGRLHSVVTLPVFAGVFGVCGTGSSSLHGCAAVKSCTAHKSINIFGKWCRCLFRVCNVL